MSSFLTSHFQNTQVSFKHYRKAAIKNVLVLYIKEADYLSTVNHWLPHKYVSIVLPPTHKGSVRINFILDPTSKKSHKIGLKRNNKLLQYHLWHNRPPQPLYFWKGKILLILQQKIMRSFQWYLFAYKFYSKLVQKIMLLWQAYPKEPDLHNSTL